MAKNKSFVIHDETVNTYGFRMLTSGADLTEFRKNPVLLLNHNDWSLPIGRWENIRIEGSMILADPVFDLLDKREQGGEAIASKVERDFLRMASVGAWAPDEVSDDPLYILPGQTRPTVTKWKVREASIVTIGSNHNALAFYDNQGELIDLADFSEVIKLIDTAQKSSTKIINMDKLNQILKLADSASEADREAAVGLILADLDRLKTENTTLIGRIDVLNLAEKNAKSAEAITLIDAAVRDGRLDANGKDAFVKLFDQDFESAKASLQAIPQRGSVTKQIEAGKDVPAVELADMQAKTWEELDKAGKLVQLKDKFPDLYKEKFKNRFGIEPKQ
jgi:hypothetical protein